MARKIAISTNKGGVLKTSITVNLAGILSKKKKSQGLLKPKNKVLIVDTDNQGNALLSFGENPDLVERTLYDVMVEGYETEKAIMKNVKNGIDILPCNDDMMFFEFDVLTQMKNYPKPFDLLKNSIESIEEEYDYILFDTPPNLGLMQGNVLTAVDEVIIPFQPESYSMRSLVKILKAIDSFKEKHNPNIEVMGVIATLVDTRTTLHSDVIQEARKYCHQHNIHMFETVIPRAIRYANSVAYEKTPTTLVKNYKEIAKSYVDFEKEIN